MTSVRSRSGSSGNAATIAGVASALSDASVNWCEAVNAIRTSQGQEWFGEDARTRMNFMNDLYARFDAAEREAKKRREGDPGIGV